MSEQSSNIAKLSQAWINFHNDNSEMRFGQYMMSTYYPESRCPSIFYEQNDRVAYNLIFEHIIMGNDVPDWVD
jgi:hypothetical protein